MIWKSTLILVASFSLLVACSAGEDNIKCANKRVLELMGDLREKHDKKSVVGYLESNNIEYKEFSVTNQVGGLGSQKGENEIYSTKLTVVFSELERGVERTEVLTVGFSKEDDVVEIACFPVFTFF